MRLTHLGITNLQAWLDITGFRNGLVMIAGPAGSGKSTTLRASVQAMRGFDRSVYKIVDADAYLIPRAGAPQLNNADEVDFSSGIKAFMRGDPDVIVFTEIHDSTTAKQAIQAAERGHLVIITINAPSMLEALRRLCEFGLELEDIKMLLRGVLLQYLIRTICTNCSGAGCKACCHEGYGGWTVVSATVQVRTPAVLEKIMARNCDQAALSRDLEVKIRTGVTDAREAYRCFSSELEVLAAGSSALRKVLRQCN
jgi:general secretion pathway protein E